MKDHVFKLLFAAVPLCLAQLIAARQPIIQTSYTADPAPIVVNDTVFLYTSHDEDYADDFTMLDWKLYTSVDMVNWTDHGTVASLKSFPWNSMKNGAWAAQVIQRNGKFYMYCPIHGVGIGVLVSDSPYGPFKDLIGKPLIHRPGTWEDIDPTVLIDDDGQAYLYWGHGKTHYVRLNEDMISYSGEIMNPTTPEHYQEGPWIFKRGLNYYLAFASTCCPEGIGYAMSDSPQGPWKTMGYIMAPTERTRGNHPGILNYKGKDYIFGFSYDLLRMETNDHHERRSVEAAEMTFNPDGTIKEVPYWRNAILNQIEWLNPYRRIEAETMAWGYGLKTDKVSDHFICLTDIDNDETLTLAGVDFGKGAKKFSAYVATNKKGCAIEIHLDSADGPLVGTLKVIPGTSMTDYSLQTCKVKGANGIHDLVFKFLGTAEKNDLMNIDYWQFSK